MVLVVCMYIMFKCLPQHNQQQVFLEEQNRTNQVFLVKLYSLHQVQMMGRGELIWNYACLHLLLLRYLYSMVVGS